MAKGKTKPSDLELQVLSVLWEQGPMTVRQLHEQLRDGKKRAYTTVLAILQGTEKKNLVSHTREGMANVYKPNVTQKQIVNPFMSDLLRNIFGGDPSAVVQCLVDSSKPDSDELKEIRKVLREAEASQKKKKS